MGQKISRIVSIDITRLVAIMIMLGNHIVHATLNADLQIANAYKIWNYYRSFTAPLFLTISGCVFFVATKIRWESHTFFSKAFRKRVFRALFLIVLGLVLQLPGKYFSDFNNISSYRYTRLVGADILRLIGFMLLFLEVLVAIVRKESWFVMISALFFVLGIIFSPLIWEISWGSFPQSLFMGFINGNTGSGKTEYAVFTIFPFSFYMFGGLLIGWFWTRESVLEDSAKRWFFLLLAGVFCLWIGYLINNNVDQTWINERTRPAMFFKHFGAAILIIATIDFICKTVNPPKFLQVAGGETLGIYFLHMPIVYGSIYVSGLAQRIGAKLPLISSLLIFVIVAAFLITVVFYWAKLRKNKPWLTKIIIASFFAIGILNGIFEFTR